MSPLDSSSSRLVSSSLRTLGWGAALLQVAVWVTMALLAFPDHAGALGSPWLGTFGIFGLAGVLLVIRRPEHPIGWLMLTLGILTSLGSIGFILASRLLAGGDPIAGGWADAVGNALATAGMLALPVILMLFPDGVVPGRMGRVLLWLMGAVAVIGAAAALLNGGWGGDPNQAFVESPLREDTAPLGDVIAQVFYLGLAASIIGASVVLIRRWRRSSGLQRNQIKWLTLATVVVVIALAGTGFNTSELWEEVLVSTAMGLVPISIVFAILRYRLYDIDRLISRTVSYALVVGLLAVVLLALVTVAATFLPTDDPLVVAVATLVVFVLFNPLRRRMQAVVDRRFNRSRYDAERVVEAFTGSLRHRIDSKSVVDGWVDVVEETMEPEIVGVWLRWQ